MQRNAIKADVIVVDEVSMLGLSTFSKLVAAIENGALVMLVGFYDQLQSVEPGNVLQISLILDVLTAAIYRKYSVRQRNH